MQIVMDKCGGNVKEIDENGMEIRWNYIYFYILKMDKNMEEVWRKLTEMDENGLSAIIPSPKYKFFALNWDAWKIGKFQL